MQTKPYSYQFANRLERQNVNRSFTNECADKPGTDALVGAVASRNANRLLPDPEKDRATPLVSEAVCDLVNLVRAHSQPNQTYE